MKIRTPFNLSKIVAVSAIALCSATDASASGWQLSDYSVTGLGRAYAGGGVVGDDFSALAYNPAGMTLGGSGAQVGVSFIDLRSNVNGTYNFYNPYTGTTTPQSGKTDVDVLTTVPNLFVQHKVNDDMTVGFGVYVPFGLAIEYGDNWFATDHGIDSEVAVMDYAPALAYKVTDKLSLGVTAFARQVSVKLTSAAMNGMYRNKFDLSDWSYGFKLGAMYEPVKDTRIGLAYHARTQQQIKGSSYTAAGSPLETHFNATLPMDAPEQFLLSFFKKNGNFGYSAGAKWTRWTRFDALRLLPASIVAQKWRSTWNLNLGLDYYYSEDLTLRTGIGFDESPVPNSHYRTAAIADNDRWMFSVGASYKKDAHWTFDVGYMFLYLPSYTVHNRRSDLNGTPGLGQLDAKYATVAHVFGLQAQYKF